MKYTIHGYSQEKSIENGLDYLDLGILRWIQDFYPAMKKTIFQNKEYGWFSYSYFLNELPIIGINTKAGLRKRIDKIIEKGFIERTCIKDTDDKLGTRSWIRLTEKMLIIISQTTVSTGDNHSFHPVKTTVSTGDNHSFHNSSINNPSINHSSFSISKQTTTSGFSPSFENSNLMKLHNITNTVTTFLQKTYPNLEKFVSDGIRDFVATQIIAKQERIKRELTQQEAYELFANIINKFYPTAKENLTPQSSISEIPNNSVSAKNIHTQKQNIQTTQFQEFWNLYEKPKKAVNWNAGNVKQAEKFFIYALKQCESFEWLMQNTNDYLTVKSTGKHGDGVKRGICSFLSKRDFPYLINWNEKLQEIKGIDPKNTVVIKQDQEKVQEEKQAKKEANNVEYQRITSKLQKLNAEKLCNDIQESITTSMSDIHKNLYDFKVLDIFEKNDSIFLGIQTKSEPNQASAEKLQNILQREAKFCFDAKYKKFEILYKTN